MKNENKEKIILFASKENWVEGEAIRQLETVASLPGVSNVMGLPDIHPGKGFPVGASILIYQLIYPHLIGSDVGCGIALFRTELKRRKFKRQKALKRLVDLENPWEGDRTAFLETHGIKGDPFDLAIGTIGGGNHFAEVQEVVSVLDEEKFNSLSLDQNELVIAIHSGSRSSGDALFEKYAMKYRSTGLDTDSDEGSAYLMKHRNALRWAAANRELIALRMGEQLGTDCETVLDIHHNGIEASKERSGIFIHRKGAAQATKGPVLVPGTRGTLSYLVVPKNPSETTGWSIAHGAGRKWNRKSSRERLKDRFTAESFLQTDLGGSVICEDKNLLFEEAPQAYKNIDTVIKDMVDFEMIDIIATLKPVITYKVRREL